MQFAVLFVLLCAFAAPAGATLFQVTGTFEADGFTGSQQAPPVDFVAGAFEFLYDDTIPPVGSVGITPTSASSQVGSAAYDESNTEVRLFFERGALVQVWWGGLALGANVTEEGTDDLSVGYRLNGSGPFNVSYTQDGTLGSFRSVRSGRTGSLVFTVVPEPSTALLVGLGLVGLAGRRGRRAR